MKIKLNAHALLILALVVFMLYPDYVKAKTYHLDISEKKVNITGRLVEKMTINNSIPGPTLYFTEGENVTVKVHNHMKKATSIHWHGLLLPGEMDGVPGFNGFKGIGEGETFIYRFKIRQSGTYWYHAHTLAQEQDGLYGSIVISPKKEALKTDRDYVVLLSDFSEEKSSTIMSNLKMSSDYYQNSRRTVMDFFRDIKKKGFSKTWKEATMWGEMRMSPTDLSDVAGYTFLMNGKSPHQNWTALFKPNESIRLRIINASAMSFFDVRIPGLKMKVISSDGQNIEPVLVDEFRFGAAETYDVIIRPKLSKAFSIVAESIDRTGFALGTLAPDKGMRGEAPKQRPRALLTMADMPSSHKMNHATMEHNMSMNAANKAKIKMTDGVDHSKMDHTAMKKHDTSTDIADAAMGSMQEVSGWSQTGTSSGNRVLKYSDLRYLGDQKDIRKPERDIIVSLGGNMERYIWTINGKKFSESEPVYLKYNERIRLKFINQTMMAHPMHLHGMFFQLENGQAKNKLPNKHTVIIQPGKSYSVLLTANEPGEWAFHCHLVYHMMSGMMSKIVVERPSNKKL